MRIFYVLNNRWPTVKAHGLQVAKTCQGLTQAGSEVTLIVPGRALQAGVADGDPFRFYGIQDRFQVVRLPSLDTVRSFLFPFQQTLFAVAATLYLMFKPGVVYTRDPFTASVLSFFRRGVFWEAHRFPARPNSLLYRRLFRSVAGIVVITQGLRDLFIAHGMQPERLAVIPDAVDPDEFAIPQTVDQARKELSLPEDRKIIGYVGRMTTFGESKGVEDLIRAFALIHAKNPETCLLIVGANPGLETHDAVMFVSHQPHERVPLYLRACDVLVMPYPNTQHYAHYMSPLKLFEYLAAGKPIVATDLPSVREIVSEQDVFFARPGDPESIAQAIERALADPTSHSSTTLALARKYSWRARGEEIRSFIAP